MNALLKTIEEPPEKYCNNYIYTKFKKYPKDNFIKMYETKI